jgi:hypothetical protein
MKIKKILSLNDIENIILSALDQNELVKITFSKPRFDSELKNVYFKPVLFKDILKLNIVYRYGKKDITKNFIFPDALKILKTEIFDLFLNLVITTTTKNYFIIQSKKGKISMKIKEQKEKLTPNLTHDKPKFSKIEIKNNLYLESLGLVSNSNNLQKNTKLNQINQIIELIEKEVKSMVLEKGMFSSQFKAIDLGSGKSYLTFGFYDYFKNTFPLVDLNMFGVELNQDLVSFSNNLAKEIDFKGLNFVSSSISDCRKLISLENIDLLLALHACNTATDDAICLGIKNKAKLIVIAPCCHQQVRKDIIKTDFNESFIEYGILLERQAELLTDLIRVQVLKKYNYQVKVIEFVEKTNSPKNILIIATKNSNKNKDKSSVNQTINKIMENFGIQSHYLLELMIDK